MSKVKFLNMIMSIWILMFMLTAQSVNAVELIFNTQNFPPFSYQVGSVVAGPVADIIRGICSEINVDCQFRRLAWSRAQTEVKQGKAHAMFVIGWSENRAKWLHFTPPILNTEYGFFVKTDNPLQYKDAKDVNNYVVGVYGPSNTYWTLEDLKKKAPEMKIDVSTNSEIAFLKLSDAKTDAVFSNKSVGLCLIKKLNITNIRYAGCEKKLNYYIGFNQKFVSQELVDRFNETFKQFHKRGIIHHVLSIYNMDTAQLEE